MVTEEDVRQVALSLPGSAGRPYNPALFPGRRQAVPAYPRAAGRVLRALRQAWKNAMNCSSPSQASFSSPRTTRGAVDLPDVVSPRRRHVGTTISQADPVRPPDGWPGYLMARRLPRRAARRPARPVITTAAVVISLGLIAAGCAGRNAATPAAPESSPSASAHPLPSAGTSTPGRSPTPARPSTAAPSTTQLPSTTTSPSPAFHSSVAVLPAAMRARMTGVTWHRGCPLSLAG